MVLKPRKPGSAKSITFVASRCRNGFESGFFALKINFFPCLKAIPLSKLFPFKFRISFAWLVDATVFLP